MSLISLINSNTSFEKNSFASSRVSPFEKNSFASSSMGPLERLKSSRLFDNRLRVVKACQFFGEKDVYIMGEVEKGFISENMSGKCGEKEFSVKSMECKKPHIKKATKGMKIGLMITGIDSDDVSAGESLAFSMES